MSGASFGERSFPTRDGTFTVSVHKGDWRPCGNGCQNANGPAMAKQEVSLAGWPMVGEFGSAFYCRSCVKAMQRLWDWALDGCPDEAVEEAA